MKYIGAKLLASLNRKGAPHILCTAMPIAMLVSCTQQPADPSDSQNSTSTNQSFDAAALQEKTADGSNLEKDLKHKKCVNDSDLKICLSSDFSNQILVSIQNDSGAEIELSHSFDFFPASIEIILVEGGGNSFESWEGIPVPNGNPVLASGSAKYIEFDQTSIEWVNINNAKKICYRTRVKFIESQDWEHQRLCLEVLSD